MSAQDALEIAWLVGQAVEDSGGEYFVGGSVASSMQGDPRSTNDIDIVLSLAPRFVTRFAERLGSDFEVDRDMLREALLSSATANAFYLPQLTKIDFFAVGHTPFDESEFARRGPVEIAPGKQLILKSPEDSVIRKLLWYRQGGEVSERQWRDILSILRVNAGKLDMGYIDRWLRVLRCADLWCQLQSK